ncbi:hypothetical protein TNCV_2999821 [Trichonephila clavipes]|nr:hypothetical protein TNCV_2999821 [Trichonephila clavipes]
MCKAVMHYHESKLLSGIDVSEKEEKVSKTTMDVCRLPAPLKTSKRFLRSYLHVYTDGYVQDVSSPGADFYSENLFEDSSAAGLGVTNFDAEIEAVR